LQEDGTQFPRMFARGRATQMLLQSRINYVPMCSNVAISAYIHVL